MRHRRLLAVAALLAGCGGAPAASSSTTVADEHAGAREDDPAERIRALEARLAEQRAEVDDLRTELEARTVPRETVRIGARAAPPPDVHVVIEAEGSDDAPPEPASGGRPVLRLYGPPPRPAAIAGGAALPGSVAPPIVPPPPDASVLGRLPVMASADVPAIPEHPVIVAPSVAPPRAPEEDPVVREYQAALTAIEARRWDDALARMRAFTSAHPGHPYADNALYWQGEIHFTRREYRRAIELWGALLVRYPDGNKVPDALLRIGLCHERLGEPERAREYFRRVREQYPESIAARLASREET